MSLDTKMTAKYSKTTFKISTCSKVRIVSPEDVMYMATISMQSTRA